VSPRYHFHPEFGLLCPSPGLRRKARFAVAALGFLIFVSAIALKAQHDPDIDSGAVRAHGDEARSDAKTAQTIGLVTDSTTAEGFRALEGGRTVCQLDFWNYIERKCGVGGKHKLQRPRAANEAATIAALPLGRSANEVGSLGLLDGRVDYDR
jgi:hypothetical protein